ncbi:MAG: hypothetical protein Q7V88_17040 [Actinomycetota bacterium]|nr:hypothetical protein [Actinomycetota bacterium]
MSAPTTHAPRARLFGALAAAAMSFALLASMSVAPAAATAAAAASQRSGSVPASSVAADVIALGDSFASGEGAADFSELVPEASLCHRAPASVSAQAIDLVNRTNGTDWSRIDATCSGAVIAHLTATGTAPDEKETVPAQLDALSALGPDGARIVTLSIGGNDVRFAEVLLECVVAGLPATAEAMVRLFLGDQAVPERPGDTCEEWNTFAGYCSEEEAQQQVEPACPEAERTVYRGFHTLEFLQQQFPAMLAGAYDSVGEALAAQAAAWQAAQGAALDSTRPIHVYINDYPSIFGAQQPDADRCSFISPTDVNWMNTMWTAANEQIAAAVQAADARWAARTDVPVPIRFHVVSQETALVGHRLCEQPEVAGDDPTGGSTSTTVESLDGLWVNPLSLLDATSRHKRQYYFHPNEFGHAAMGQRLAEAILATLAEDAEPGAPAGSGGDDNDTLLLVAGAVAVLATTTFVVMLVRRRTPTPR